MNVRALACFAFAACVVSCGLTIETVGEVKSGWVKAESPETCSQLRAVWADSNGEPYVVCLSVATMEAGVSFDGGFDSGPGGVISTSVPHLVHHDDHGWSDLQAPGVIPNAVWATTSYQVWIVGKKYVARYVGGTPTDLLDTFEWSDLRAVFGFDDTHVFVGGTKMLRFDGTKLIEDPWVGAPDRILGIGGASASDVWAVSEAGFVRHFDGAQWSVVGHTDGRSLRGVWASSQRDVWAVGDRGLVLHFDGNSWAELATHTDADLTSVWGSRQDDVWIVGQKGTILHAGAGLVRAISSPTTEDLLSVSGTNEHSAWAIGDSVVLRMVR